MGESTAIARTGRPTSGHARYIGRVGGLAFALGVGAAVLVGAGAASADTSESSGSATTSSSSSSSADPGAERDPAASRADPESDTESDEETYADEETVEDGDDTAPEEIDETDETDAEPEITEPVDEDVDETPGTGTVSRTDDDDELPPSTQSLSAAAAPIEAAAEPPSFFDTLFDNESPTLAHNPSENSVDGDVIVGDLHPEDGDSTRLTYTATKPTNGTVVINPDGTFVYTPGAGYSGQDRFDVTVSDALSGFHVHGFEGFLSLFSFGLLGNSGHRTTETVFIGFDRAVVVGGLNKPVDFRWLPDGRIIVAEKDGAIRVVQTGVVVAQPAITLSVDTFGERGISGLAVDPAFAGNGYVYVAYTTSAVKDRLSRFTMVGNSIAATSEKLLLESPGTVAAIHHGGALGFGTDGKLYWGKGDNGSGSNAQDLTNIYGKILRINPDGTAPSDNPVLGAGALPQIYAYGLRNPFRLAFTPDGKLLVADVGSAFFEELNLVTAGGNHGWPGAEGICATGCVGLENPIYTYPRGGGAAITSVLFYNGGTLGPHYQNKVFIADTVQGFIRVLTCTPEFTSCGDVETFDPDAGATVVLAQGPDGNIYQLTYSPGTIVRIAPAGRSESTSQLA